MNQRSRLLVLVIGLALLMLANIIVDGTPVPDPGTTSLWFYSAALSLLLADFVVEPWYTRPADSLANATAILLASLAASSADLAVSDSAFRTGKIILVVFTSAVMALSLGAMVTRQPPPATQTRIHSYLLTLSSALGRSRLIFSIFFAVTAAATFASSPEDLLVLYLIGGLLLWTDTLSTIARKVQRRDRDQPLSNLLIREVAQPRSAFASASKESRIEIGSIVSKGGMQIGLVVDASEADANPSAEIALFPDVMIGEGDELVVDEDAPVDLSTLGPIGRGTSLDRLIVRGSGSRFDQADISEGSLIEVSIRGESVLYQVVDAEIESAAPEGTSTSKRVQITARKLGRWDEAKESFVQADWIPAPGQVARRASASRTEVINPAFIGRVPGTDYGTHYDPITGATHNTAILGILGIGKTTLATELVWRTLEKGAKVIIIDVTNEYANHFEEIFSSTDQAGFENRINEEVKASLNSHAYDENRAGNHDSFKRAIRKAVHDFVSGDTPLLILNPARLIVTQDDGGFPNTQSRARRIISLNPAEITALIARAVLECVSDEITDRLRVCLVLEEAHSLAPEWNSTANDGERQAATATARALMQGRKFGFGSIVVTQRTANVTKSILNQCNTVFALRIYDQTGTEFLGNFIGGDYSRLLANLRDRHAIVFGKASSCKSPLLVELNDRELLEGWREEIQARISVPPVGVPSNGSF